MVHLRSISRYSTTTSGLSASIAGMVLPRLDTARSSWETASMMTGSGENRYEQQDALRSSIQKGESIMANKRAVKPDSTAVRVALWRAQHVQIDPPPHVLEDEIGLKLVAPSS